MWYGGLKFFEIENINLEVLITMASKNVFLKKCGAKKGQKNIHGIVYTKSSVYTFPCFFLLKMAPYFFKIDIV